MCRFLSVVEKMIKTRKESIVQFQAGNRPDLVEKESKESRAPPKLSARATLRHRTRRIIAAAIAESGAASIKDMGKVMAIVKGKAQGRADMGALERRSRRSG